MRIWSISQSSCPSELGHNYLIAGEGYHKKSKEQEGDTIRYDNSIIYVTLYCTKCGKTKEIIIENDEQD